MEAEQRMIVMGWHHCLFLWLHFFPRCDPKVPISEYENVIWFGKDGPPMYIADYVDEITSLQ
jgi:hypothetical protein